MQSNFSVNRDKFLRGKWRRDEVVVRPPWALTEAQFIEACDGCGDCIPVCESQILVPARGRYPKVDFTKGECTFCEACLNRCPTSALTLSKKPWSYVAQVNNKCLSKQGVMCRTCADLCDYQAITFRLKVGGFSEPEISLENCNGCGACVSPCPTSAIEIKHPIDNKTVSNTLENNRDINQPTDNQSNLM